MQAEGGCCCPRHVRNLSGLRAATGAIPRDMDGAPAPSLTFPRHAMDADVRAPPYSMRSLLGRSPRYLSSPLTRPTTKRAPTCHYGSSPVFLAGFQRPPAAPRHQRRRARSRVRAALLRAPDPDSTASSSSRRCAGQRRQRRLVLLVLREVGRSGGRASASAACSSALLARRSRHRLSAHSGRRISAEADRGRPGGESCSGGLILFRRSTWCVCELGESPATMKMSERGLASEEYQLTADHHHPRYQHRRLPRLAVRH